MQAQKSENVQIIIYIGRTMLHYVYHPILPLVYDPNFF